MREYYFLPGFSSQFQFDSHACQSDNFRSRITQYVRSHYGLVICYQKFTNSIHSFVLSNKTTGISHREFYNTIINTFHLQTFFCLPYSCNLRIGIYYTGNSPIAHDIFLAKYCMHSYFRLTNGCMCQQRITSQVTTYIYSRSRGLHLFVCTDIPSFRSF